MKNFGRKKCNKNETISSYKGYVSSYYVDILNSFNHELQLKYTESAIRNKLIDLYTKLRGFKFVTTLVIEFKKYKVMMQQNISFLIII